MKQILLKLCILCIVIIGAKDSFAQCTAAQLNWDRLDYYFNSGSNVAPYGFSSGNYVTNAMEQTQKFAIGPNYITFVTSAAGMVKGENGTHTGDVAGYTGDDAQFTPTVDNQTLTLTFDANASNVSFTLYDVDLSQQINFGAKNAANVAQTINVVTYASSILTIANNNATNARITASATSLTSMSDNRGTATITIAGPVKTITLTFATVGTDGNFWLSDIDACVSGTFPTNYNQTGNNQPLQGPVVNQPDYFLVTPDNNSVYMVDPATGNAWFLFSDPANTYVNSMGYDPYHHILYYVSENYPAGATNKKLKKYDFNTGTISTVLNDITTALNIPTFDQSLEGAGACFYNGQLYLGVEGGKYDVSGTTNDRSRESIVFRIDFDASLNPTNIVQVFATPSYVDASNTMLHDWADFVIKDGILYNYNSQTGTTKTSYEHYNMMTGATTKYMNPGSTAYAGQSGIDWSGNLYDFFTGGIAKYNLNGTFGTVTPITAVTGGPWPGGNGDAGENFRPKVDFGDAPATYDPNPLSPAAHSDDANLRLGAGVDKEWITAGHSAAANSDNFDDGLPYVSTFNPTAGNYLTQVNVYNNTGADATVCAWLDYNGNGVFDASEGFTTTVTTSASTQLIYLYWTGVVSSLPMGSYTYLRIRVTYASSGMTTSHPTGYFNGGEVEDYRIPVNTFALAVQQYNFDASLTNAKSVKLNWDANDDADLSFFEVQRSSNSIDWETVSITGAKHEAGTVKYENLDKNVFEGSSYYRLKITAMDGKVYLTNVKKIENKTAGFNISIAPNPAITKSALFINSSKTSAVSFEVVNAQGAIVYQQKTQIAPGTNSVELPVSNLSGGQYIVRVIADGKAYYQSLIINK